MGVPYVVPGGRFDEMYGWDSYFIVLGLLEDERLDLARGFVDNFTYVIEHYGATLNANRTYYLTRSQPPFFTSMLRAVWEATPPKRRDVRWLKPSAVGGARRIRDGVGQPAAARGVAVRGRGRGRSVPQPLRRTRERSATRGRARSFRLALAGARSLAGIGAMPRVSCDSAT